MARIDFHMSNFTLDKLWPFETLVIPTFVPPAILFTTASRFSKSHIAFDLIQTYFCALIVVYVNLLFCVGRA